MEAVSPHSKAVSPRVPSDGDAEPESDLHHTDHEPETEDQRQARLVRPRRPDSDQSRNVAPHDRAIRFFGYVAVVVLGGVVVVALAARGGVGFSGAGGLGLTGFGFSETDFHGSRMAAFAVIALLAVLVDLRPFRAPGAEPESSVFTSITFTFALLLGWGLAPAAAVQSAAVVVSAIRLRYTPWRAAFNASQYALALGAASAVLATVAPPAHGPPSTPLAVAVTVLAALAWFVTNDVLVTTAVWLRFEGVWGEWTPRLTATLRQELLAKLGLLALGPLVVAAASASALLVPLTLAPLYAVTVLARYTETERTKSLRDELTELPNRTALMAELTTLVRAYDARARRLPADPRRMALLLLDIDKFRRVNDALGHGVGDRLLLAVAERLTDAVGSDALVARLGGDEFGVLAARLADPSAAGVLAERVAAALTEPVTLEGLPLDVTAAIGVALHPDHGSDTTTLLRRAEVAMYDAKDRGALYAVYTPESDQNSVERLELLADLRRALELGRRGEITLHYQPQVDLFTGEVVGVEALLRWNHPRRGMVSPQHLIRLAEHTAVMRLITQRVVDDAVRQLAIWRAQGQMLRVSINVSVRDLHRPEWVDQLADLLVDRGVEPNQVQLEITEGALMADPRRVLVTLHRLDKLGVALSLDDFGTGYSSLQHLRRLPLAEVKVDRSFVLGMASDPDDAAVVASIIDLSRALGLRVVAEGVEDDRTRRMLIAAGCEVAQGWFYARPMPADDLLGWLARYRPTPTPQPFDA
jgi:diguanylate cyclase (GGDEF)-like protein